jgi:uncharacterized protein (DUF983 family)
MKACLGCGRTRTGASPFGRPAPPAQAVGDGLSRGVRRVLCGDTGCGRDKGKGGKQGKRCGKPQAHKKPPRRWNGWGAGSYLLFMPTPPTPAVVPRELDLGRASRHVGRALLRRCPNCGAGGLFTRWLFMVPHCPRCHLKTDRGEHDYFLGSFTINFVVAELMICLGALVGMVLTWPDVPWDLLKWSLMALVIPTPMVFYRLRSHHRGAQDPVLSRHREDPHEPHRCLLGQGPILS